MDADKENAGFSRHVQYAPVVCSAEGKEARGVRGGGRQRRPLICVIRWALRCGAVRTDDDEPADALGQDGGAIGGPDVVGADHFAARLESGVSIGLGDASAKGHGQLGGVGGVLSCWAVQSWFRCH